MNQDMHLYIAFVILIMVLLIKPTGILGKTTIEKM